MRMRSGFRFVAAAMVAVAVGAFVALETWIRMLERSVWEGQDFELVVESRERLLQLCEHRLVPKAQRGRLMGLLSDGYFATGEWQLGSATMVRGLAIFHDQFSARPEDELVAGFAPSAIRPKQNGDDAFLHGYEAYLASAAPIAVDPGELRLPVADTAERRLLEVWPEAWGLTDQESVEIREVYRLVRQGEAVDEVLSNYRSRLEMVGEQVDEIEFDILGLGSADLSDYCRLAHIDVIGQCQRGSKQGARAALSRFYSLLRLFELKPNLVGGLISTALRRNLVENLSRPEFADIRDGFDLEKHRIAGDWATQVLAGEYHRLIDSQSDGNAVELHLKRRVERMRFEHFSKLIKREKIEPLGLGMAIHASEFRKTLYEAAGGGFDEGQQFAEEQMNAMAYTIYTIGIPSIGSFHDRCTDLYEMESRLLAAGH